MKPLSEQTLYEILEVADDAPPGEIQRAYERARSMYGPGSLATYTLMAPEEMALLGRRIEEAGSVLLDPEARAGYDAGLASGTPPPRPGPTHDSTPTVTATVPPGFMQTPVSVALADAPAAAEEEPPAPPAPASPPFAAIAADRAEAPAAPPRPLEKSLVVPEGARWTGELLRRAREARGLTVPQLAERTKISRHHIENLEGDRFARLPAPVYLRGMVLSLSRELRLDGQKVARSFLEHMAAAGAASK